MPIIISTAILVALYAGIAFLVGGTSNSAFDAIPFAAFVGGAGLFSAIVFWPSGGKAAPSPTGEARRQPELLAFVAFAKRTHELANNPHRTGEGSEALAARLREEMEVPANHPVRLVWPEQWINAPLNLARPGVHDATVGLLDDRIRLSLRRRAAAALSNDETPAGIADRLRKDDDAWRCIQIGDVTVLARIHTESKVGIGERLVVFRSAGGDAAPKSKLILAFLIPKPGAPAVPAGNKPDMEGLLETRLRRLLSLPDVPLGLVFPDKWTGGPRRGVEEVLGKLSAIDLAVPISAALEESGYASGTAARFLGQTNKWDCLDLEEFGHLLLFGVIRGTKPGAEEAAEPSETAVVGFMIHPEDSAAAEAAFVDDMPPGALEERLGRELGLPEALVTVYHAGDWRPPTVATANDIHRDDILRGIAQAAFERVLADGVDNDLARGALGDGAFETLVLPTTGRVVLFRKIKGSARQLGRLG